MDVRARIYNHKSPSCYLSQTALWVSLLFWSPVTRDFALQTCKQTCKMSAEMMQGIFLPISGFETTLVYNACAVTKLPWVLEKKFDYLYETPRESINLNLDVQKRKKKWRRYNLMNKFRNRKEEQSDNTLHAFVLNCHFLVKYDIEWLTCNVT